MVELRNRGGDHGIDNTIFIPVSVIVVLLVAFVAYRLRNHLNEKKRREEERKKKREAKKK